MERLQRIERLKSENFDLLVIGGGATGAGIALDAATRGLKVALLERDDFASGSSSKSTKLLHGGVRYLEQAVKNFDRGQLHLVKDALKERSLLLKLAPHLTRPISLLTPLYKFHEKPYYRMGLKIYDWLAGKQKLFPSKALSPQKTLQIFPLLKSAHLKGSVLYADGQFDDARMNVAIALTAREEGAVLLNHAGVESLLKQEGKISGARVKDLLSGEKFSVKAKVVINAAGPFVDQIRKMDDLKIDSLLTASSGIHIIIDKKFSPPDVGLLIPKTEDGRVLFILPWLGATLVGTTDNPAKIEENPKPSEKDIQYILRHIRLYYEATITRNDVKAAWSGLRPLVSNPKKADTAKLSRDHVIEILPSHLITVTGGKWTTYRKMAEDAVNQAVKLVKLKAGHSKTEHTKLVGGRRYKQSLWKDLVSEYSIPETIARHLALAYGGRAFELANLAREDGFKRLSTSHPYLEAEVLYAVRSEMAETAIDVLARRLRLAFLDQAAAIQALPRVLELMAKEFHWTEERFEKERKEALHYLR